MLPSLHKAANVHAHQRARPMSLNRHGTRGRLRVRRAASCLQSVDDAKNRCDHQHNNQHLEPELKEIVLSPRNAATLSAGKLLAMEVGTATLAVQRGSFV